jgi:hypothetical protein
MDLAEKLIKTKETKKPFPHFPGRFDSIQQVK